MATTYYKITDIHEADAFFRERYALIGKHFEADESNPIHTSPSRIDGYAYVEGGLESMDLVDALKPISGGRDWPEFVCFYAVKFEEDDSYEEV